MKNKPFTIQGVMEAKSGKEKELEQILTSLIEPSRNEPGCLEYNLHRSTTNPKLFMFYENWIDEAAFKRHITSQHIQEWVSIRDEFLVGENEITFWEMLK